MFWRKKSPPTPLGIPLGELRAMLEPTSLKPHFEGDTLVVQHGLRSIRVEVVPPATRETADLPIQAVVRVVSELPAEMSALFRAREAEMSATFNAFAALGALYLEDGSIRIGSRLTIYDEENAWDSLQLPLLAMAVIGGSDAILGGARRVMTNEPSCGGESAWDEEDFAQVERILSPLCVCSSGRHGFTAEFGLADGELSAIAGDHRTALFQLLAAEAHPELGGGLFCLLHMPHRAPDLTQLQRLCLQLNSMEMAAHDLPPHFGAWCPGKQVDSPAYVSFLPNAMHELPGVATNFAVWAASRAQWANAMLASLGLRA